MQSTTVFHMTANVLSILSETFLLFHFAKSLLSLYPRKKAFIIAAYLLLSLMHFIINTSGIKQSSLIMGAILAVAVDLVFVCIVFMGALKSKFRLIIIYYLIISSVEFFIATIAHIFIPGYTVVHMQENASITIVLTVIVRIIEYGLFIAFLSFKKKDHATKITSAASWFIVAPIISIAVFWLVYPLGWALEIDEVDTLLVVFAIVLLFLNAYILTCCHAIKAQSSRYIRLSAAYHEQHEHFQSQTEVNRAIRKMAHDMRHHCDYLAAAIQKSEDNKAISYIEELQAKANGFLPKKITGNADIDALLSARMDECEKKGISLVVSGFLPDVLPFSAVDINIMLGNALENAIEATQDCVACGVNVSPSIEVALSFVLFRFGVNIKNPYCHSLIKMGHDRYYSHKHKGAGLGTEIMGDVVKKYDGAMLVCTDESIFQLTILLNSK